MNRANQWREMARAAAVEEAVELTLPSGARVLARRPDPLQLASWEKLPFSLVEAVMEGRGETSAAAGEGMSSETVVQTAEFMRELLLSCVVSPRITLTPASEDEIHPREIPQRDWLYIVGWALRTEEVSAMRGFRAGSADGIAGGDGAGVARAAERTAGDRGPGDGAGAGPGGGGVVEHAGREGNAGGDGDDVVRTV